MNRALIWKEWRQQRSLVFAAIVAALLLPLFVYIGSFGGFRFDSLTQVLMALQMIVVVPVFAAATGALSFADDRIDNTMGFLLSRPASRVRVWVIKVSVAFLTFLVIWILTLGIAMLLSGLVGGPTISELVPVGYWQSLIPFGSNTRSFVINAMSQATGVNAAVAFFAFNATGPGFLLLLFAASVFWSTRSKRPLSALLAGILTAMILEVVETLFIALQIQATGRATIYPMAVLYVCLALLIASFVIFRTTEPTTV
ncbi:MAG: ABC transporter permease [Acidobacteriota bacterium]|jgi:ABC-type transport system involved in multi-copper enzyme maturation permease subunit